MAYNDPYGYGRSSYFAHISSTGPRPQPERSDTSGSNAPLLPGNQYSQSSSPTRRERSPEMVPRPSATFYPTGDDEFSPYAPSGDWVESPVESPVASTAPQLTLRTSTYGNFTTTLPDALRATSSSPIGLSPGGTTYRSNPSTSSTAPNLSRGLPPALIPAGPIAGIHIPHSASTSYTPGYITVPVSTAYTGRVSIPANASTRPTSVLQGALQSGGFSRGNTAPALTRTKSTAIPSMASVGEDEELDLSDRRYDAGGRMGRGGATSTTRGPLEYRADEGGWVRRATSKVARRMTRRLAYRPLDGEDESSFQLSRARRIGIDEQKAEGEGYGEHRTL